MDQLQLTNPEQGPPNIHGSLILKDTRSCVPTALMDFKSITAWRTGAASALSAQYLARPDRMTVRIIACCVQEWANLEALTIRFPIRKVYLYDASQTAQEKFIHNMPSKSNIDITGVSSARQAVEDCDPVVTSGPIQRKASPTIKAGWRQAGTFASSVDFGSYWTNASLLEMDRITTHDAVQFHTSRNVSCFDHVPEPFTDLAGPVSG